MFGRACSHWRPVEDPQNPKEQSVSRMSREIRPRDDQQREKITDADTFRTERGRNSLVQWHHTPALPFIRS